MEFSLSGAILAFGIIQGLLSSLLIQLSADRYQRYNQLLAWIFCALSLSLTPTLFGQLGLVEKFSFLHFVPLDFSLFLFPLLFLYLHAVLKISISNWRIIGHLSIGISFWLYFFIVWVFTTGTLEKGAIAMSLGFFEIQFLSQLVWVSMVFYYSHNGLKLLKKAKLKRLSKSQISFIPWVKTLIILFIVLSILEVTSLAVGKYYGYWRGSPLDEWLGISFSMLVKGIYAVAIYLISFLGYARYRKLSYSVPTIQQSKIDEYLGRMISAMKQDQVYLNPDFTLSDLASLIQTSPANVSSLLNKELNLSFNDFVNRYRVDMVKEKLTTDAIDKYTLLSLAKDSGFKSKTTFYRAFQKFTKETPSSYIRQIRRN